MAEQLGKIHHFGPWQIAYKATNVLCPDGKRRSVHSLSEPDTYFSIPGTVKVRGVSVRGYITGRETEDLLQDYEFRPYTYGKNHGIFESVKAC